MRMKLIPELRDHIASQCRAGLMSEDEVRQSITRWENGDKQTVAVVDNVVFRVCDLAAKDLETIKEKETK